MDANQILATALAQGVALYLEDGQLKYKVRKGQLPGSLKQQLRAHKSAIIDHLQRIAAQSAGDAGAHSNGIQANVAPITARTANSGALAPVSYAQQGLWLVQQLDPSNTQYNMPGRVMLTGNIDLNAFKRTLHAMLLRHEVLRSCFTEQDGELFQRVLPLGAELDKSLFQHIELQQIQDQQEQEQQEQVAQYIKREANTPFNLTRNMMLRITLLSLSPQQHLMLYTMHHIATDGWSMALFNREFTALYKAFSQKQPNPLPPLAIQYADYAIWQREQLSDSALNHQLDYWQTQLAGAPGVHSLPLDSQRQTQPSQTQPPQPSISAHRLLLEKPLANALHKLATQHDATLFMVLQSAFALLLSEFGSSNDIVMGTPIAGRNRSEVEPLIGLFLNALVLRTQVDNTGSFADLLRHNKPTILDAFAHQDTPFEKIVERMQPDRRQASSPLFQIWFVLQTNEKARLSLGDTQASQLNLINEQGESQDETAKYELNLYISESARGLHCTWKYHDNLFSTQSMHYLSEQFTHLLQQICAKPEAVITDLALFVAPDPVPFSAEILANTAPRFESIIEHFSHVVSQYGDRPALMDVVEDVNNGEPAHASKSALTYQQLDQLSSQLAAQIQQQISGQRVGLLFGNHSNMVVAILATLKAGKTYVPLDINYPSARLQYIAQDAQLAGIIHSEGRTETADIAANLSQHNPDLVCMVFEQALGAKQPTPIQEPELIQEQKPGTDTNNEPAYILYTSGSTGQPKGVYQSQRNVLYFAQQYANSVSLTPADNLLQLASFNFDASVMDLYGALLSGACLHVCDIKTTPLPHILNYLQRAQISVYHSTPTVVKHLADAQAETNTSNTSVKYVVLGGEAVSRQTVAQCIALFPQTATLINGFGPTESTLALQHHVPLQQLNPNLQPSSLPTSLSLGKAVAGTRVQILRANGSPARLFETGQIVIESPYVALGYWQQQALSAERFVALENHAANSQDPENPENKKSQIRRYYTGDHGCLLPNGNIQFTGRHDNQVKIQGVRLELGEVEAQLDQLAGVQASVACKVTDTQQQPILLAFVVLQGAHASDPIPQRKAQQLKAQLRQRVPGFMIPSQFVLLNELPLTPSGKTDRQRLLQQWQAGQYASNQPDNDYVAPQSAVETTLCTIWQTCLKRDNISIHDDFFAIGGHSLLAARVISAIRSELAIELPLKSLFNFPTVALLSEHIEQLQNEQDPQRVLPPIQVVAERDNLPLSFAQQRLWFIDQLENGSPQYNMPGRLRLRGELSQSAFEAALRDLLQRHEVLRTRIETVLGDDTATGAQAQELKQEQKQAQEQLGEPRQVIDTLTATSPLPVQFLDWRAPDKHQNQPESQQQKLHSLQQQMAQQPFNLSRDAMMRLCVVSLSNQEHAVLFTLHHIASDGWSMAIFRRELRQLYAMHFQAKTLIQEQEQKIAPTQEQPVASSLPALPVQYADYAQWQRQWLVGDVLNQQLSYWQTQLADIPVVHSLPLDNARPAQQEFTGNRVHQLIDAALLQQIQNICQQQGVTLFMYLQSVFALLIGRYSQQNDVVIGSPVAGRQHQDIEGLIGFFVNTLVLRNRWSPNSSFAQLLADNKTMILDALAHQHIPFERLVDELSPERQLSHMPITQILFILQNNERDDESNGERENERADENAGEIEQAQQAQDQLHVSRGVAVKFDLELTAAEWTPNANSTPNKQHPPMLRLGWSYKSALFSDDTVCQMAQSFALLLRETVRSFSPESLSPKHAQQDAQINTPTVQQLAIMPPAQQQQLLSDWSGQQHNANFALPFNNIASEFGANGENDDPSACEHISYAELNRRANLLATAIQAQYLSNQKQNKSAKENSRELKIGISMQPGTDLIVGILAILKAGACYVPIDPGYPQARIAYLLEDSQVSLVLELMLLSAVDFAASVAANPHTGSHLAKTHQTNTHPDNLAYMIYTSGSTGKPKAVLATHGNVASLVAANVAPIDADSRVLCAASVSFDAFTFELWCTLLNGGTALLQNMGQNVGHNINQQLSQQQADTAWLTAGLLNQIIDSQSSDNKSTDEQQPDTTTHPLASLKYLLAGGEALSVPHIGKALAQLPNTQLINGYGPTENTTFSCCHSITHSNASEISVPIGKPIFGKGAFVLDSNMQPVRWHHARLLATCRLNRRTFCAASVWQTRRAFVSHRRFSALATK